MNRKATFSPKRPKPNSSDHNSRKEIPNYLIENNPKFDGNYYEKMPTYESDEQFIKLAKKIYNEKFIERVSQNQKMQKKQADALLWEVAISTEEHHTKENILELFKMLKNEKAEVNKSKRGLDLSRLKPVSEKQVYVLPSKLRIKRKPKKENFNETGYHILELAGHGDEGHFIRIGEWENLSYYPARDILLKDDGNWYIKSDELNENKTEETFDILANMTEFEKVYNYHWHVKYTNFNLDTGLSAQFSKGEVSGKGRLKKVAEFLGMRYIPEEKIPIGQSVKTIKEQHHIDRQNKFMQLMIKFGNDVKMKTVQEKVLKREEVLVKKTTIVRALKKANKNLEDKLQDSMKDASVKQDKIISLENKKEEDQNKIDELEEKLTEQMSQVLFLQQQEEVFKKQMGTLKDDNNTLTTELETKEIQLTSDVNILEASQKTIEALKEEVQKFEILVELTGYEIKKESVFEYLYDYVEKQRAAVNYKSSRIDSLEEKLVYEKELVEAINKQMNDELKRHKSVEKEFVAKEESLNEQIQELRKDVFSETWTRKDGNGVRSKSKNINVVKQLKKNNKKLNDQIETLKDEIERSEAEVHDLILETEHQADEIAELEDIAYFFDPRWNPDIGDFVYVQMSYKNENESLVKEFDQAKQVITIIREYNVPISEIGTEWEDIKENILGQDWDKRDKNLLNTLPSTIDDSQENQVYPSGPKR